MFLSFDVNRLSRSFRVVEDGRNTFLAAALGRNVLGSAEPAHALASYVRASKAGLAAQSLDDLLRDGPRFAASRIGGDRS